VAFDWLEHDGRRSVSEKERVGTVLPIRDSRESLRADNQDSSNSRRVRAAAVTSPYVNPAQVEIHGATTNSEGAGDRG